MLPDAALAPTGRPHLPLAIGHRGASAHAPENTRDAFRAAIVAGADGVETDVRLSSDGVAFLLHDEVLDRTTDALARGITPGTAAETLAWSELEQLDAGGWFAPQFRGTTLVTLADLAGILGDARVDIEIKEPTHHTPTEVVAAVDAALRSPEWAAAVRDGRVLVTSFDPEIVDAAVTTLAVPVGLLVASTPSPAEIAELAELGVSALATDHATLDAEAARAAHEAGIEVWAWTANDRTDYARLTDVGADAIITDDPAALHAFLAGHIV